ncbi:MAG: bifunctional phosphopantothenoylcysteine decarboxylase/phosphopantothenate--cysteine ligase CoaBC [Deltaproteobacteria bacterium]|jgi:phosphopantothenoylcysteine decarboxylase/phosphopantothenate--cysteine ligase|nr:bifunctional phosphopantothenoylcysteine decarboxylase/phosphopantothenate--cysteine ligase CoaBC [Deltaproteobacteria bacterium]
MEKYFPQAAFAGRRVHLGVTGSISAYKALDLLRALYKAGLRVSVGLTEAGSRFVSPLSFKTLGAERVYNGMFPAAVARNGGAGELSAGIDLGEGFDPIGHLTPGAWADAFIIYPASATTLARITSGMADEMLAAQALAFPKPLLLAPAMNPRMWQNPATQENCATLRRRGHIILEPEAGRVACNEEGQGKLVDLRIAYLAVLAALSEQDFAGRKLMLTMGPTREQWDGVRFWSNPSTGVMGAAFAVAASLRGAEVHAICGPGCPWLPPAIKRYDILSSREMNAQAQALWPEMDYGIFTAAVADFYPEPFGESKFKKSEAVDGFSISFRPGPDILAGLGRQKAAGQKIVGFAAETSDLQTSVRKKLVAKNADLLVGNLIGVEDSGFAGSQNQVFVADRQGREESWQVMPKAEVAWRVLDWLLRL